MTTPHQVPTTPFHDEPEHDVKVRKAQRRADLSAVSGRYQQTRHLSDTSMREGGTFWRDVFSLHNNVAPLIALRVLGFGVYAFLVSLVHHFRPWEPAEVTVVEFTGVFLAMMLVLRTNSGYDRWWEARRLWAGIVNASRNLTVTALAFGPRDARWRERFVRWTAAYAHVCKDSLRSTPLSPRVITLVGADAAARIEAAPHRASYAAHVLAELIAEGTRAGLINTAVYRQHELQRTVLVDHMGSLERILGTRFPRIHRTMLGQLMVLYLLAFPFATVSPGWWTESVLTMIVAYLLFALDQVARELGNPFSTHNRSHLPLDEIALQLEEQLLGMLAHPVSEDGVPLTPAAAPAKG